MNKVSNLRHGAAGYASVDLPQVKRLDPAAALALILLAAFALRLSLWQYLPNIHHPDEIFQYLEAGHRLVFGYGVVPWEYRVGTRSWLLPGAIAGLMRGADSMGLAEPTQYGFVVAAAFSALSLSVVAVGFLWAYRRVGMAAAVITGSLCAVWFELVYFAPKTLSGPVAAYLLVIAVYLACPGTPSRDRHRLLLAGLLLGLVVVIRVNLAPAALVLAVYVCRGQFRAAWAPLCVGGVATFVAAGLLDAVTWDYPFQAFIANVWVNIVESKSHEFGISPWYHYVAKWVVVWGGAMVPILALCALASRRHPLLALLALTIVATHMLFAHKEYRFVFPAVPFIAILIGLGTAELFAILRDRFVHSVRDSVAVGAVISAWTVTSAILAISDHFRPYWQGGRDDMMAFAIVRDAPDLCGFGLVDVPWWRTGGYTYLHRDVPMTIATTADGVQADAFNYALARREAMSDADGFEVTTCLGDGDLCILRREGSCQPRPRFEINETLKRRGK